VGTPVMAQDYPTRPVTIVVDPGDLDGNVAGYRVRRAPK
jgi:hypothetical protein